MPAGITIGTTLDSADFVTPRIAVLINNLATGMLLVLALLWFTDRLPQFVAHDHRDPLQLSDGHPLFSNGLDDFDQLVPL